MTTAFKMVGTAVVAALATMMLAGCGNQLPPGAPAGQPGNATGQPGREITQPVPPPVIDEVLTGEQMDVWLSAQYAGTFTRTGSTDIEDCQINYGYQEVSTVGLCRLFDYTDQDGIKFTALSRQLNTEMIGDDAWIAQVTEWEPELAALRGESAQVINITDYAYQWAMAPKQRQTLSRIVGNGVYTVVYPDSDAISDYGPYSDTYGAGKVDVTFPCAWAGLDGLAEIAAKIETDFGNPVFQDSTAYGEAWGEPNVVLSCTAQWGGLPVITLVHSNYPNIDIDYTHDAAEHLETLRFRYIHGIDNYGEVYDVTDDVPQEWREEHAAEIEEYSG